MSGADSSGATAAKQFELRIRKETTGAVVLFQTYPTFDEARKVAERLAEVGCPGAFVVEVTQPGETVPPIAGAT